jgi:SAM-dependent MidA family methyltransferase
MKITPSQSASPLEQRMIERIHKEGPITFDTFMEMALYEPGLGYYASGDIEIGRAGDFYTSQHVHPAFGAMIARQLEEMWEILGRPSDFYAIEPGAGAGLMCMDIMDYLKNREVFHSLTYIIIELNSSVRQKQKTLLEKHSAKVRWVSSLKELERIRGCVLSNELLDAFPVHLVEMDGELKEIYISVDGEHDISAETDSFPAGNIQEIKGPLSTDALPEYLNEFDIALPEGYRTEINLRIRDWLKAAGKTLSEGFILTIDYGYPVWEYYSEERNRGTLLCYSRHQLSENPYVNIGKQDITAHINFSSLKKWGEEYGFRTLGFSPQGTYLVSLGIDELIKEMYATSPDYLLEVAKIKKLIFPGTLGETHKVMIQYKGDGNPNLRGFLMKNQKNKL